jgi:hypothetical protein
VRILRTGELPSSATRYRWQGFEADGGEIAVALAAYPDPDPSRPFELQRAVKAVFQDSSGMRLELPREAASKRGLLRRKTFWEALIEILAAEEARYLEYSYKEKADCYRIQLTVGATSAIRNQSDTIAYKGLAQKIRLSTFEVVDVYVPR